MSLQDTPLLPGSIHLHYVITGVFGEKGENKVSQMKDRRRQQGKASGMTESGSLNLFQEVWSV